MLADHGCFFGLVLAFGRKDAVAAVLHLHSLADQTAASDDLAALPSLLMIIMRFSASVVIMNKPASLLSTAFYPIIAASRGGVDKM